MYRNVIDIRREVPKDVLKSLVTIADKAFNNRAGKGTGSAYREKCVNIKKWIDMHHKKV